MNEEEKEKYSIEKYSSAEHSYQFIGHLGRGLGLGLIVAGILLGEKESTILAGLGLAYVSNSFIRSSDYNAHAREQAEILRGIEKKLR